MVMMLGWIVYGTACSPGSAAPGAGAGENLPAPEIDVERAEPAGEKTAIFAGGCFWCVEAVFEELDGVRRAVSGYSGGTKETADYRTVCSGTTDHAEVVRVVYDPSKITYGQLLRVFFATHDPTTLNRQGPDTGTQYRSAVFYADDDEKRVAEAYIAQLNKAGVFPRPIVTKLEPLEAFYEAEEYHQDYVRENPDQPYVRAHAIPKVEKLRKRFPGMLKD
jgi:peptide-methionine (S)-S-oxide reductase